MRNAAPPTGDLDTITYRGYYLDRIIRSMDSTYIISRSEPDEIVSTTSPVMWPTALRDPNVGGLS
jgi:hypothetical protein